MIKADLPRAPLVLAVVLAQLMETSLRQALMLSEGSLLIFVQRPLSAFFLALVLLSLALPMIGAFMRNKARRRERTPSEISVTVD
jgi:putative tricarboxylic transport membrane protein